MRSFITVTTCATLAFAVLAGEQIQPKKFGVEFVVEAILRQMDKDGDGKISKAEATGRIADGFALLDANKDGFLDRPELRVVAQRQIDAKKAFDGPGGADFDSLDRNADGRLTPIELKGTRFAERFAEIDADRSGQIDRREFELFQKKQRADDAAKEPGKDTPKTP